MAVPTDVGESAALRHLEATVLDKLGPIAVLMNTAGVPPGSRWLILSLNPWMNAETASDTSSMKHTPPTMAKDTNRAFR